MREQSPRLPLVSLVFLISLTTAAVQAQPTNCGVPPTGRPWGCALQEPPPIRPSRGELNTSFVVREQPLFVPVWTASLCKGTLLLCTQDSDCPGRAAGSCANAQTCADSGRSCTRDGDCNPDVKCVNAWGWQSQTLRTYGTPIDPKKPIDPGNPNGSNLRWGHPGPSLYARSALLRNPALAPDPRTNPVVIPGTRIKVKLYNSLKAQSFSEAMTCMPASYSFCTNKTCSNDDNKVCTRNSDCGSGNSCNQIACGKYAKCNSAQGPCQPPTPVEQKDPNCFHASNVTNLHLHGTHVSPLPHQDYVLLSLFPAGSQGVPRNDPRYAVGTYDVNVNPLPWNQPPGTHWYHPHKHGSTSLQVQNGMAGALIIEGAFDDWLKRFYKGKLVDRILVVQQISALDNFFNPSAPNYPPRSLVDGMATPVIRMRPREIQRWRFIGATTQASASLRIGFDPRITDVRQIAQDGVQFAWQNYDRQPLRDAEGTYKNFRLSPGNRADFLIQAPEKEGIYTVSSRVFIPQLAKRVEAAVHLSRNVLEGVPPTAVAANVPPTDQNGNPLLFTIQVVGPAEPMSFPVTESTDPACRRTPKPTQCWPETPYYLRDLTPTTPEPVKIAFSMDGNPGGQPNDVWVNGQHYQQNCANVTTTLNTTLQWLVSNEKGQNNTTLLAHPFHIHTNPFQVVRDADRTFSPPYIWQDTIALPVPGTNDEEAGPISNNDDAKVKCPRACQASNATWNGQWKTTVEGKQSVCGCEVKSDSVEFLHRYDDYTGAYVLHCHFLGHEDRGMMWNVQTVCPPGKLLFGQPQANGGADNCRVTSKALDRCSTAAQ